MQTIDVTRLADKQSRSEIDVIEVRMPIEFREIHAESARNVPLDPLDPYAVTLHAMFADRDKIKRTVKNLPDGAEAVTELDDETIAELLKEPVPAMEDRVLGNNPLPPMTFHPIFVELIKHAKDYTLTYEETDKGMQVTYQSDDPYVVMLVQEHAKRVSRFIKNGMDEIHAPYQLPKFNKEAHTDERK